MKYFTMIFYVLFLALLTFLFFQVVNNEKLKKRTKIFLWILLGVLAVGFYPLIVLVGNLTLPGQIGGFVFYHGQAGDRIVAVSSINQGAGVKRTTTNRIQSIDLANGKKLASVGMWSSVIYLAQSGDVMWFYNFSNGIEARDPDTLQVTASEKDLKAKNPAFGQGISSDYFALNPANKELVVMAKNGNYFEIDPKTLMANAVHGNVISGMRTIDSNNRRTFDGKAAEITLADKSVIRIEGDPRGEIRKNTGKGFSPLGGSAAAGGVVATGSTTVAATPGLTFLDGSLLGDSFTRRPVEMNSPSSFFVLYKRSTDDGSASVIARVSASDGKILWEKSVFDPESHRFVKGIRFVNDTLFVVTSREVVALRGTDGTVQWTISF